MFNFTTGFPCILNKMKQNKTLCEYFTAASAAALHEAFNTWADHWYMKGDYHVLAVCCNNTLTEMIVFYQYKENETLLSKKMR